MTPESLDFLLENRRSLRKYKPEAPPEKWVEGMLKSAIRAPSPSNSQPVRFIRLRSETVRTRLLETMRATRQKYLQMIEAGLGSKRLGNFINYYWRYSVFMFDAPVLFAVGTVKGTRGFRCHLKEAGFIENEAGAGGLSEDADADISLGLALKGFILKAETYGLGTCILTAPLCFVPRVHEIIGAKEINTKCFITAGFAFGDTARTSRKPVAEVCYEI